MRLLRNDQRLPQAQEAAQGGEVAFAPRSARSAEDTSLLIRAMCLADDEGILWSAAGNKRRSEYLRRAKEAQTVTSAPGPTEVEVLRAEAVLWRQTDKALREEIAKHQTNVRHWREECGKIHAQLGAANDHVERLLRELKDALAQERQTFKDAAEISSREEAAQAILAAIRKVRDGYADQARFADIDCAVHFREFVRRLDAAVKGGAV